MDAVSNLKVFAEFLSKSLALFMYTDMNFTTPPPPPCKDKKSGCGWWAQIGNCKKYESWMKENCYASCKYCKAPCEDKKTSCGKWAGWGECKKNPGWMNINCAKSCGQC